MLSLPSIENLETELVQLDGWLADVVLTVPTIKQSLIVLIIVLFSLIVSRRTSRQVNRVVKRWNVRNIALVTARIHLSTREVLFLMLAPLLLWLATRVTGAAQVPNGIINVMASLVSAWAIIRIGSGMIRSSALSKLLALFMCLLAALNILGWLDPVVEVLDKATITSGTHPVSLLLIIKGTVAIAFLLWVSRMASEGFERAMWRSKSTSPAQKVLFTKLARIGFMALAFVLGLNVLGIDFTALAVFGGAVGIGVGFGLQKVFSNLISGFILLMDKSIKPGDVIAIGDSYGWVNHIGARYVSILTRDGKEHLIPNEKLITDQVENWSYSNENIRLHVPVVVPYASDRRMVKELLLDIARKNPRILKNPEPTCLIKGFNDSGVEFELRVWIEDPVNGVGNVRSSVYEAVWDVFKEHGIAFPYPQRDLRVTLSEQGDPASGAERSATLKKNLSE